MQTESRPTNAEIDPSRQYKGQEAEQVFPDDSAAHASVWIDPVIQQNISASYVAQETHQWGEQEMIRQEKSGTHGSDEHRKTKRPYRANPITPIPPRASALPADALRVRPRYPRSYITEESMSDDVTRVPTLPPAPMWQYESPDYEVESSIPSLSLMVPPTQSTRPDAELRIEEIDTVPPAQVVPSPTSSRQLLPVLSTQTDIDQIDTAPPQANVVEGFSTSWTTGSNSPYARRIAERAKHPKPQSSLTRHPLDRLRWWLLYPGRMEFLLWLGGTVALVSVTCVLLFVTSLSAGWLSFGQPTTTHQPSGTTLTTTPGTQPISTCSQGTQAGSCVANTTGSGGLKLVLLSNTVLYVDMTVDLQGQGFKPDGPVMLTHDGQWACQPTQIQTDAQGTFHTTIELGPGNQGWQPGHHIITATDTLSQHTINVSLTLSSSPAGNGTPATSATPGTTPTPASTPTTIAGGQPTPGGANNTPVPVTPTPTVGVTPTPRPTPSPTVGVTPTPVPTQVPTPTPSPVAPTATAVPVTPTSIPATPTTGATAPVKTTATPGSTSQLGMSQSLALANQLPHTGNMFATWLLVVGYTTAMCLLGLAGLLHHRRKRAR